MTRARDLADSADKDIAGTLTLDAVNASGVITGLTVEATGDTAAGDNAAMGYTAAEGLILTGQGSTSDITLKNDADAVVFSVPTGTDDILFPDNAKVIFGTGTDFEIYSGGTGAKLHVNNGVLEIEGDSVQIWNAAANEAQAKFTADGSVELYHNGTKKFETTSAGVAIGTSSTYFADADDLVIAGSDNQGITIASGTSSHGNLFFADGTSGDDRYRGIVRYDHSDNAMKFYTNGANERFKIASDGSISTPTAGTSNTRLGVNAGDAITANTNYNVLIGDEAGTALNGGDNNVAVGYAALYQEDGHGKNVAVGKNALYTLNAGADANNTAVGFEAGVLLSTGTNNVLIGSQAGDALNAGAENVAVGVQALSTEDAHGQNTAVGMQAFRDLDAGATGNNTALGHIAGRLATTTVQSTLIGAQAGGSAVMTGDNNVAVGFQAGRLLTSGSECTFVGTLAGDACDTSGSNTAVGFRSLSADCGTENTVVGSEAATAVTGSENVFIGASAAVQSTSCDSSVVIGKSACSAANMTGNNNTVMGVSAGLSITSGAGNVIIGKSAGTTTTALTTGASNIIIGLNARTNAVNTNNAIVMGENVSGQANNNFSFGVGTTDSNIVFGEDSITTPSDERYKEDITTSTAGLAFIKDLRPVTFKWKKEKDVPTNSESYVEGSDTRVMLSNGETNHGFIAQEVKTVMDNHPEIKDGFRMWAESDRADKRQRLGSTALIPILVKAIQELEARIVTLEG